MNDLVERLRIKAGVIEMGEKIAWSSDTDLMREAADVLEEVAAVDELMDAFRKIGDMRQQAIESNFNSDIVETEKERRLERDLISVNELVAELHHQNKVMLEALQSAVDNFDEWAEDADPSSLEEAHSRLPWVSQARDAISLVT